MKQTTIYLDDKIREEVDERVAKLSKELGVSISLNGYINYLINNDLKENQ